MQRLFGASLSIALAAAAILPAAAADLPQVKLTADNQVPACATPGRLMAYLRMRNPKVDERFDSVATEYMRHGEVMGLRWDVAFFQMILETGALSYKGDVRSDQNNFAGLGASGGGARGERFADISSGVKAHLQHLLMYAGDHIDDPVAERTRKVQEWGVLTKWQQSVKGPMTFSLVAKQWAPGSRSYVRDIATIGDDFYNKVCTGPDPRPQLVQEARKGREGPATQIAAVAPVADEPAAPALPERKSEPPKVSGAQLAERAIEEARKDDAPRVGLGAASMLKDAAASAKASGDASNAQPTVDVSQAPADVKVLNAKPETEAPDVATSEASNPEPADTSKSAAVPPAKTDADGKGAQIQTASVAGAATQLKTPPRDKSAGKCKVWTASYGGQRAILIKAMGEGTVNYTVLDVNETTEKREVDAYIAAYAKGGEKVGSFTSPTKALDKAFELCPEG